MISLKQRENAIEMRKTILDKIRGDVQSFIQSLQPQYKIDTRTSAYSWQSPNMSVEVAYVQESGRSDFGSSFTIYFEDGKLGINAGSIGTFDKTYQFQIARIQLLATMFGDIEYVESFFKNIQGLDKVFECERIIDKYNTQPS